MLKWIGKTPNHWEKVYYTPVTWIKGQRGKTKHFLGFVDGLYSGCIIKG